MEQKVQDLHDRYLKRWKSLTAQLEANKETMSEFEIQIFKAKLDTHMYFIIALKDILGLIDAEGNHLVK